MGAIAVYALKFLGGGLGFVKKYWKEILIVVTIGVVVWQLHHKSEVITKQKEQIVQLKENVKQEHEKGLSYLATIDDQNEKLVAAKTQADKNQEELKTLQTELDKQKVTNKEELQRLRNKKLPTDCISRDQYLKDNLKEVTKW